MMGRHMIVEGEWHYNGVTSSHEVWMLVKGEMDDGGQNVQGTRRIEYNKVVR